MKKQNEVVRVDIPISGRTEKVDTAFKLSPVELAQLKRMAEAEGHSFRQFVTASLKARLKGGKK